MKTPSVIAAFLIILFAYSSHAEAQWWNPFAPKNFDECILDKVKEGMGEDAVRAVQYACAAQFRAETKQCVLRNMTSDEVSRVQFSEGNISVNYFTSKIYNGSGVPIKEASIILKLQNMTKPQTYKLHIGAEILPNSAGDVIISVPIRLSQTPTRYSGVVPVT